MIAIIHAHIKTMIGDDIPNGTVLIGNDGKIAAIGLTVAIPEGAEVIDAEGRLVTPGCSF